MIRFLLNEKLMTTEMAAGTVLVDLIRYHQHLTGTKIGCREGDCGACTVLIGEAKQDGMHYNTATSCLMPLGNVHGKHVVTIEGISMTTLNPIQQAIHDEAATQCGFCTPGIVMSLAGFCLRRKEPIAAEEADAAIKPDVIAAVDGNICRCTGYKSIERAACRIAGLMQEKNGEEPVHFLTSRSIIPAHFIQVEEKLKMLQIPSNAANRQNTILSENLSSKFLGGGTDLYVQQHQAMVDTPGNFMFDRMELKGITQEGNRCVMGASATVSDILQSPVFHHYFPRINRFMKLVSSTPIRNMATVAGNFINASPIGDLTIFFLALNARLILSNGTASRELLLQEFYKGYKSLNKEPEEYIESISFPLPGENTHFNFEKVSKRTHLDIASVNTAILITVEDEFISAACLSAGGVGPVPMKLTASSAYLTGKKLSSDLIYKVIELAEDEISPISDARGSAAYKRLLLKQLIKAHFITLFPYLQEELLYA